MGRFTVIYAGYFGGLIPNEEKYSCLYLWSMSYMRTRNRTRHEVVSMRLHPAQIQELDRLAAASGRSRTEFLQDAVAFFITYWRRDVLKEENSGEIVDKTLGT